MALATLSIDILAKLASFEQGMDKAARIAMKAADDVQRRWDRLGAGLATVGGAIGTVLGGAALNVMARDIINGLDALNDLKDATGASIENLSALEDVALRTGTSMETVGGAVVKMNKVLADAEPGSATANILKQLGLDAQALRDQDPAEALRQLAVALSGFEDNGNKARIVQELFGKSIKEVAPLLNDLAEKGRLVGTVTAEQAAEAEKFNKQLAVMEKNALDLKRAVASELLPTLNQYLLLATQLSRGPGLFASLGEVFRGNTFTDAGKALAFYSGEIARVDQQIKSLQADNPRSIYSGKGVNDGAIASLQADRERFAKFADVYRIVVNADGAGAGRGSVTPLPPKPSLGNPAKKTETTKPELDQTAKAYDTLIAKITHRNSVAELEIAGNNKVTESQRFALEVVTELAKTEGKYTDEQKRAVTAALEKALGTMATADAQAALRERLLETARAEAQLTEQLGREAEARIANNQQLRDEAEEYGLNADQLEALRIRRLEATAAQERETLLARIATGAKADELAERSAIILALDEEIRLRKTLADRRQAEATDPVAGARRAAADYQAEVARTGDATYRLVRSGIDGLEDRLTQFFTTGKADWKSYFATIAAEAARVKLVQPGVNALLDLGTTALANLFTPGVGITGANTGGAGLVDLSLGAGRAYGGPVGPRALHPVVERGEPEVLNTPSGSYLLTGNQSGNVVPLRKFGTSGGAQTSAQGGNVYVQVQNNAGAQVSTETGTTAGGDRFVKLIIDAAVSEVDRRIAAGGSTARAISGTFRTQRATPARA